MRVSIKKNNQLVRNAIPMRVKNIPTGSSQDSFMTTLLSSFGISTVLVNPYKQYAWSYACIKVIARAISGMPLVVKNSKTKDVITDKLNPWVSLFNRPNRLLVGTQFWRFASTYYETFGQVFIIPRDSDYTTATEEGQIPKTLEIADPRKMLPIVSTAGVFSGWEYRRSATVTEILSINQVIRLFELNTDNILTAQAPSLAVSTTILSDIKAHNYNEKFFENGGQIQGILSAEGEEYEDLTVEERDEIRGDWDSRFSGENGAHKTPLLTNGLKYIRTGASQKDMDFKELMVLLREEVLSAYGVPKTKLGLTDKVDRAVSKTFERQFYEDTIMPKVRDWESVINNTLLVNTDYEIEFDASGIKALSEDDDIKLANANTLHKLGYPINSINRVQELGMEEIDEKWANEAVDARSSGTDETGTDPSKTAESSSTHRRTDDGEDGLAKKRKSLNDEELLKEYEKQVLAGKNFNDFLKFIKRYISLLEKEQITLVEQLKGFLGITKDSADSFLFDINAWNDLLMKDAEKYMQTAFKDSTDFLAEEIGGFTGFVATTDEALKVAMKKKLIRITGINVTIRNAVRAKIVEGITANNTVNDIAESIRDIFNDARSRSLTIARTEIGQASGVARHIAMNVEGLKKKWLASADEVTRNTHVAYASLPPQDMFYEYATGLKYPGDMDCSDPAEVVNCRCMNRAIKIK